MICNNNNNSNDNKRFLVKRLLLDAEHISTSQRDTKVSSPNPEEESKGSPGRVRGFTEIPCS